MTWFFSKWYEWAEKEKLKTATAKYMAKEAAEDVKDTFEGAMNIMESKRWISWICTNKRNW